MTSASEDPRVTKALRQVRVALKDPAIARHLDDDTLSLLNDSPGVLVGSTISDLERAVEQIPGEVKQMLAAARRMTTAAENMAQTAAHTATAAATSAAQEAVTHALGDIATTVNFVRQGETFVAGGTLRVANNISTTLIHGVYDPVAQEIDKTLHDMAVGILAQVPFVGLIRLMIDAAEDYERRANYVLRSLITLEQALEGKVDLDKVTHEPISLGNLEAVIVAVLRFLWSRSIPGILISLVDDPSLANLLSKLLPVPPIARLNFLHVWLTEKGLDSEELEFRKQFVACIDQFVRDRQSVDAQLAIPTGRSARTGSNILSELASVVFSLIGGFTFRHEHVPSLTLPKLHWTSPVIGTRRPFDGAHVVSTGVSRFVSYSVKSAVATVGRGAWEINAHNDALVEGVASAVSSLIGTLIQSVLNDLFWSVRICEIYEQQVKDALVSWDAVSDGSGEKVFWGVSLRTDVVPQALQVKLRDEITKEAGAYIKVGEGVSAITDVLQSYTAYMDAIRSYTDQHDECADETIAFESNDRDALSMVYTCATDPTRCPVVRAYCYGKVTVLTPDSFDKKSTRVYTGAFGSRAPEGTPVFVRSNYGASASSA